ncbi:zinc-dependent alcohol dehydrogenase family protein (plasmid) [Azospirillum oryzae]|uniref:Zinc-dependent alcohol dehydrogenase family protein n=1 Tax=Azospirillum oryzae TaxID=286727 RepID=A0A6N1AQF1_9PROT|nr:zinc-dependent alcohol dehydrogenase family protein [Azospirillum oryzae]KAA0587743.1 zinc-dependent alcohol dehydrogenase family protein [Azospirillum oryzae]QKS53856.1 zinc-dependent alcohol dehydrogenase family protein [Azospirillum oryzae]GLR81481.1 NADPH:quinone oxidoreductase [Azospirillum oryzae]
MRAMVISRFGGPDVFELQDRPRPVAGPGELLVRVVASGTNPVDAKIRQAGSWAGIPFPAVLGYDVSGVVEEVGPGVTGFKAGDEVFYTPEIFGNPNGSYAEYTVAAASIVAHKPPGLSHVEAAGIPLAGGTAWEAIVRRLAVRPGETVLIHGGAGGVGSFAIQFAKAAGARVLATASKANHEAMRDLGADVTLDYRDTDVMDRILREAGGAGVDAAFDTAGGNVPMSTQATRPFGRIATILPPTGDLDALYVKNQTLYGTFLTREGARLREMAPLFERGQARVIVDEVLPLEQVGKAHERLDSGHGRGKIILQVGV